MNFLAEIQRLNTWLALVAARVAAYFAQPNAPVTYAIDPSNSTGKATDAGPGTAAAPFLTTAPLYAILNGKVISAAVTINILSNFPGGAPTWAFNVTFTAAGSLTIKGQRTIVRSGTISASVDLNQNTNVLMTATDSVGFDFTPFIGNGFIKITSGAAAGNVAPIRGVSAGHAILGGLGTDSPQAQDISPVSHLPVPCTYQLFTVTNIPDVQWNTNGPYAGLSAGNVAPLVVTDVQVTENTNEIGSVSGTAQSQFGTCLLGSIQWETPGSGASLVACIMTAGSVHFVGGRLSCQGGIAFQSTLEVETAGIFTEDDFGLEASAIAVDAGGVVDLLTMNAFNCDTPFLVDGTLRFLLNGHFLFGANNTTTTMSISMTGVFENGIGGGNTISIANNNSGTDFTIDGQTSTSVFQKQDGTFAAGPVTNTWAHLAATNAAGGFQNFVSSPTTGGARIVPSTTV